MKYASPKLGFTDLEIAERKQQLTDIQIQFVERIIKESEESKSHEELIRRLLVINKDIHSVVPNIQQERLCNVTSVLYYALKEIDVLEREGYVINGKINTLAGPRLKSFSEDADGGTVIIGGKSCSRFLATVWSIAIGEPTPLGEIVASVITVVVGGVL